MLAMSTICGWIVTNNACRGVQGAHAEVAELRRAVDHDNVEFLLDLADRRADAAEKQLFAAVRSIQHRSRRMMLELHQFEIPGHQRHAFEIGGPRNLAHRAAIGVVAQSAIECLVLADVKLRLMAEHAGKRGLRIEIDRQYAEAFERKELRKV